jgi:hypothetical protein
MWRDTLLSIQIIHDITELAAAREGLVGERELLATTLASIGDTVIITDPLRRCHLPKCGGRASDCVEVSEAAGLTLPEVFRILNEQIRKPVEDPVEKVLRLRNVVGLAST